VRSRGYWSARLSILVSLALSSATIAVAWLFYRPVLGVALLVLAGGAILLTRKRIKATASARAPAEPSAV
jgi:hypothetical protein